MTQFVLSYDGTNFGVYSTENGIDKVSLGSFEHLHDAITYADELARASRPASVESGGSGDRWQPEASDIAPATAD